MVFLKGPKADDTVFVACHPDSAGYPWAHSDTVLPGSTLVLTSFQKCVIGEANSELRRWRLLAGYHFETGDYDPWRIHDVTPGDKRMVLGCGTFDMVPDEVDTFVVAILYSNGNTGGFSYLVEEADEARWVFSYLFPLAPMNLTANGGSSSPWTNDSAFHINWINLFDVSGIATALYKLDSLPTSNYDTTHSMSGIPPDTIYMSIEGVHPIYVWLLDGSGNVDYNNNSFVNLRYDSTPPFIDSTTVWEDTIDFWGPFPVKTKVVDNYFLLSNPVLCYKTSQDTVWRCNITDSSGANWYIDSIPPQTPSDSIRIYYYISVEDSASNISRDLISDSYSFVIHSSGVEEIQKKAPDKFVLFSPFPNPFLRSVMIKYGVLEKATIALKLYDISGRLVKNIWAGEKEKGYHIVELKCEELTKGIYFIRFEVSRSVGTGDYKATKKTNLVKIAY